MPGVIIVSFQNLAAQPIIQVDNLAGDQHPLAELQNFPRGPFDKRHIRGRREVARAADSPPAEVCSSSLVSHGSCSSACAGHQRAARGCEDSQPPAALSSTPPF